MLSHKHNSDLQGLAAGGICSSVTLKQKKFSPQCDAMKEALGSVYILILELLLACNRNSIHTLFFPFFLKLTDMKVSNSPHESKNSAYIINHPCVFRSKQFFFNVKAWKLLNDISCDS